jgi:hypothetical protein
MRISHEANYQARCMLKYAGRSNGVWSAAEAGVAGADPGEGMGPVTTETLISQRPARGRPTARFPVIGLEGALLIGLQRSAIGL